MIYYDITDLLNYFKVYTQVTGIQRVTIEIIKEFVNLAENKEKFGLITFHQDAKRPMATDPAFFQKDELSGEQICAYFGLPISGKSGDLTAYLERRYSKKWQRQFHGKQLELKNWLTRGRTFRSKGIAKSPASVWQGKKAVWTPVEFEPGSVIYLAGGTWGKIDLIHELGRLRSEHGVKIVQIVYDLIPVKHPAFIARVTSFLFEDWLVELNKMTDMILTNAQSTQDDLISFAKQGHLPPYRDIRVVPLAHEFVGSRKDPTAPELGPNALYARVGAPALHAARLPYVLCVGTLEVRKNNWGLAQVWQSLKQKHGYNLPRLIFAGRKGWMNEEFEHFLKQTQNLDDYIKIVEGPSDAELAYLYEQCLFSIFPSFCEGWGLPIGECLWFGRPVIASNTSSMPEVAGDFVDYADPSNLDSMAAAIERMLDPTYRESRVKKIKSMPMRRWRNVADDIWAALHSV